MGDGESHHKTNQGGGGKRRRRVSLHAWLVPWFRSPLVVLCLAKTDHKKGCGECSSTNTSKKLRSLSTHKNWKFSPTKDKKEIQVVVGVRLKQ